MYDIRTQDVMLAAAAMAAGQRWEDYGFKARYPDIRRSGTAIPTTT